MRKIIFILFFLFISEILSADPIITVYDYLKPVDFTNRKIVLLQKGDNPAYKNLDFDDSSWEIISLPSSWDKFYQECPSVCWYRLHIRFPLDHPKTSIGIKLGVIDDVDEVFFNGYLIGKSGEFSPNKKSAYDKKRIYEIPSHFIRTGAVNILAIRVEGLFPGEMGAYKGNFKIASFQYLLKKHLLSEFIDVLFVAIYLAIGLYFSLIFITKSIDKEYLFFSLLTISTSVYIFLRTQIKYFITDNFYVLKLIEYIVLILLLFFMMEYITYFYKRKHTVFHYIYFIITGLSLILIIGSTNLYFWNNILIYLIEPSWILPIGLCLYISIKGLSNDPDSKYLFVSFVIVWIMFINDVLIQRNVYDFISLARYGFMIIIIGTAIIMHKRFNRLHAEVRDFRLRKTKKPSITEDTKAKFDKAITYLEENFTADIARENFAEAIGLNHDYLGKLFIQLKGMKMNDYINHLRVKKASEMLKEGNKNIADIAFDVGFESLSTFYRVFQKIMNESPTNYREKNKNNISGLQTGSDSSDKNI